MVGGVSSFGIIGHYFFEKKNQTDNINCERYDAALYAAVRCSRNLTVSSPFVSPI